MWEIYFVQQARDERSVDPGKNPRIQPRFELRDLLITGQTLLQLSYWTQVAAECGKMVFPRTSFKSQLYFSPLKVVGLSCACCRTARCTTVAEALLAVLISQGLTAGVG